MSRADNQSDGAATASPTRPSSAWTNNSLFTDSAISMRTRSPAPLEKESSPSHPDETHDEHAIADRLNGLVSEIWACEQDGQIRGEKRRKIEKAMDEIEAVLEDEESDSETTPQSPSAPSLLPHTSGASQSDLELIRMHLSSTVESMRMRQQEQRHLHQLATEKLEAIAQRCIQQERRVREFAEEIVILKKQNRNLIQQNENLNVQLSEIQSESAKKETAVKAMSSAVSGLEGWINGSPTSDRTSHSRKIVTRGRGRFRGRYYVEEPVDGRGYHGLDGAADARLLQEGVTAWLRGFRDVEEELRSSHTAARFVPAKDSRTVREDSDNEWGEFQTAGA
ncbi:uncharacterized protein Z520_04034 [Fonsecaea multimorphosa CBS 102226]|uniref:Uncharacterized protein n=1 Tax=Fonsecaea multimorphosa CBS 102226 TaxID=1442371 RepID=A0A0D2KUD1_9EURO|nr:uncharacterized protein Z520_04034 [Fonsecaea multimorphosa CBS 102226]KIY00349.1 hypothetical protein Z520_04034 [Fonsecaea multimorphosa CBS 102226]OAL27181.1 hypothetical protein AYO22_03812 [Fonsecaea multimorphosa]